MVIGAIAAPMPVEPSSSKAFKSHWTVSTWPARIPAFSNCRQLKTTNETRAERHTKRLLKATRLRSLPSDFGAVGIAVGLDTLRG
ncbi:hypothetical protein GCM10009529_13230 [Micropruina glycogenica]